MVIGFRLVADEVPTHAAHLLLRHGPLTQVLRRPLAPCLRDLLAPFAGGRRRATSPDGRGHAVREAPRREQETGVPDHAMLRPDGEALEVPAADHGLPRGG